MYKYAIIVPHSVNGLYYTRHPYDYRLQENQNLSHAIDIVRACFRDDEIFEEESGDLIEICSDEDPYYDPDGYWYSRPSTDTLIATNWKLDAVLVPVNGWYGYLRISVKNEEMVNKFCKVLKNEGYHTFTLLSNDNRISSTDWSNIETNW